MILYVIYIDILCILHNTIFHYISLCYIYYIHLSGESAKGKYPVQSVAMMNRIVAQAEAWIDKNRNDGTVVNIKPSTFDMHKGNFIVMVLDR